MATLYYLENFNNYYNRTMRLAESRLVSDFNEFKIKTDTEYNFNPNDHVTTSVIVNYEYYDDRGILVEIDDSVNIDYLLVSEDNVTVKSKWFVTDRTRTLGGQWALSLRRDLVADYIESIKQSTAFIEKGYIDDTTNTLIFNNENMMLNKIKVGEHMIKDEVNTPWIIGYVAKNVFNEEAGFGNGISIEASAPVTSGNDYPEVSKSTVQSLFDTYGANGFRGPALSGQGYPRLRASIDDGTTLVFSNLNSNTTFIDEEDSTSYNIRLFGVFYIEGVANIVKDQYTNERKQTFGGLAVDLGKQVDQDTIDELIRYSGQTVKDPDSGQLFTYSISSIGYGHSENNVIRGTTLYNQYVSLVNDASVNGNIEYVADTTKKSGFYWINSHSFYSVSEPQVVSSNTRISGQISKTIKQPSDAPYYIFAMPFDRIEIAHEYESGEVWSVTKGYYTKLILEQLMYQLGPGQFLYDVQLLPFTPTQLLAYKDEYTEGRFVFDFVNNEANASEITQFYYSNEYGDNKIATVIFWLNSSSFRNLINFDKVTIPWNDPLEFKIENETKMYRLVSPNYAGAFEFSATKNNGLTGFEVNCTMKPYQPYIHINPIFGGLYGGDYNDSRGLICGGDFTIPQTTDAWRNFQIQNKSYQEAFNRQIDNMEVNNAVQREREIWNAIGGAVSGVAGGAMTGAFASGGHPAGIAAGAVIGGAMSVAGGIRDVQLGDKLREEAIDYTKDQFGYNLQNIKALPTTMSRTSAFDVNNKLFPFLEFYDCSETEKQALKNKILYNGMTVMVVGKINDYIGQNIDVGSYVKAQLIRFLGDAETHEVREISNELNKGVYF